MSYILPDDPSEDPINGDEGYPHEIELQRIREWPDTDLFGLMAYVKVRWSYPDRWVESDGEEHGSPYREFYLSTGGWSGNESLIDALAEHKVFSIIAPWSWHRGGHHAYRIPLSFQQPITESERRLLDGNR